MEIVEKINTILSEDLEFNDKLVLIQNAIVGLNNVLSSDEAIEELNPLEHTFGDGMYIRKVRSPAGQLLISKQHKQDHPWFLLEGKLTIIDQEGSKTITAPANGITKAGTKRLISIIEDVVWVTVHRTNHTDVDKIEEELIDDGYRPELLSEDQKKLI